MDRPTAGRAREGWSVGAELPPLVVIPDRMHLFMFSAITWNRHHVHYDREAAIREGLPDVVVHRGLVGNYLARLVADWAGDPSALRALSWKMIRSAGPGRPLTCRGRVTGIAPVAEGQLVTCDLSVVDDAGESIAVGEATLAWRT